MKLNFGCGRDYKEGWVNIDHSAAVRRDFASLEEVGDLEFDEVLLSHVLEHIQDLVGFMEHLYSYCAPGAQVLVNVPFYNCRYTWSDPDHKHAISAETFDHFNRTSYWPRPDGQRNPITAAHENSYFPHCDFQPVELLYIMDPQFADISPEEQAAAIKFVPNSAVEMRIVLEVIKPPRENP